MNTWTSRCHITYPNLGYSWTPPIILIASLVVEFIVVPDQIQVDITLEEIRQLQEEKTAVNNDVETVLELEQREYEVFQEVHECSLKFDFRCGADFKSSFLHSQAECFWVYQN